nr:MAG TPA: hypothetical protein [Bacteriophage sp.]
MASRAGFEPTFTESESAVLAVRRSGRWCASGDLNPEPRD